ncbi:MAG: TonB family protein [Pyrinomonadaceae bacterium]
MPLNLRNISASFSLIFVFALSGLAQTHTSGDVMRGRVSKAKAFIAVRNYNAAIYELENIRRETGDPTVNGVINVLLMNSYLEQSDYKRAQEFLKELSSPQKLKSANAASSYFAVAGQVVKGARSQLERYRALGLSVSDRNLPLEAATDIEKMRETLEMVVAQSKFLSADKNQTSNAMALLEEATSARSGLARDDFDVTRWKNETADARETLANSSSVVVNAVNEPNAPIIKNEAVANPSVVNSNTTAAAAVASPQTNTIIQTIPNASIEKPRISETAAAKNNKIETPVSIPVKQPTQIADAQTAQNKSVEARSRRVETAPSENSLGRNNNPEPQVLNAANTENSKEISPMKVGSLIEYATKKTNPVYPVSAKTLRMTGVVKVELVIDETGQVAEVGNASGPAMLQRAATDAIKKWKFKPFVRGGESVKATGFVSFNFSL